MPDPHHDLLRRLFDKALDLPPAARRTFLDSKCGDDPGLKQRLQFTTVIDHTAGARQ